MLFCNGTLNLKGYLGIDFKFLIATTFNIISTFYSDKVLYDIINQSPGMIFFLPSASYFFTLANGNILNLSGLLG